MSQKAWNNDHTKSLPTVTQRGKSTESKVLCPRRPKMPLNTYAFHIVHICFHVLLVKPICRFHITLHINEKTINWDSYLSWSCQICAYNKYTPDMPHMTITSCAHIRHLCQNIYLMNSMQSIILPGTLLYIYFTLLAYALRHILL